MALPLSNGIYEALRAKGVVDTPAKDVRRCIIDLRPNEPARVLVETVGDEELLSLGDLLDGENAQEGNRP